MLAEVDIKKSFEIDTDEELAEVDIKKHMKAILITTRKFLTNCGLVLTMH